MTNNQHVIKWVEEMAALTEKLILHGIGNDNW